MSSIPTSLPKQFPIVCRVNPKLWWMVALGSLETAFMLFAPVLAANSSPAPQDPWGMVFMGGFGVILFGSITGYLATELLRSEIRADEQGLTWRRGFASWKSTRWEEISDFYIHKHGTLRIVETPQGKIELSNYFIGIRAVADLMPLYALNAPTQQWGRRGFRQVDSWSISLSTWSKYQQWLAPLMSLLMLCSGFSMLTLPFSKPNTGFSLWQWYDVCTLVVAILYFGSIGLLTVWMAFMLWHQRRQAWQHRDETLFLNAQGLIFSSNQRHIQAKWEELLLVEHLEPRNKFSPVLVHTSQGDFELLAFPNSPTWLQFRRLAQEYAPWSMETLTKVLKSPGQDEDLDGPQGAWSGPQIGEGARVFSVRSRGNRLNLICVSVLLVATPFLYLISLYVAVTEESPFTPHWPIFWGACFWAVLVVEGLFLWFKRTSVWVDGEGLLLHWPLRSPRRIRWEEIEGVGRNAWGEWVLTPSRKIYFTFLLNPLRHDELLQLIEGRGQKPPSSADDFASS